MKRRVPSQPSLTHAVGSELVHPCCTDAVTPRAAPGRHGPGWARGAPRGAAALGARRCRARRASPRAAPPGGRRGTADTRGRAAGAGAPPAAPTLGTDTRGAPRGRLGSGRRARGSPGVGQPWAEAPPPLPPSLPPSRSVPSFFFTSFLFPPLSLPFSSFLSFLSSVEIN